MSSTYIMFIKIYLSTSAGAIIGSRLPANYLSIDNNEYAGTPHFVISQLKTYLFVNDNRRKSPECSGRVQSG